MKIVLIIAIVLFASCKKEPQVKKEVTYTCSDDQRNRMTISVYSYLNSRTDLSQKQKDLLLPTLEKEAVKTYCTINRN